MGTSAQLGPTGGSGVDHIYDFSGGLSVQDSVPGQRRVSSDPHWSQAKETFSSTFYPISSTPRCGFTKTQSGRALRQTLGFFCN